MTLVCYAFVYIFEALIALMFFGNKFNEKYKRGVAFLSFMASAAIQFGLSFFGIPNVNLATFIIFNFLLCFLCYETKVTQAVFNSLLLAATMLITELITVYVSRFAFGIGITEHTSNDMLLLIQSGTAKLLYFLTAYLISKFATKEIRSDLKNTKSALLLLLPIASIVVLLGIVRITELYATTDNIYILFSVATILLMYANITVFWVHESLLKTQRENTELQLQAQKAELDTEYYTLLQNQYENSNILIHDIKRHLLSIKELSNENDCDGIEHYIDNLYSEYEVKNIKKYSNHKLVNAIINRYAKVFADSGITFNCDIRNIDFSFIADNDLTSLLDNLLENALEASRDSEEKKVELQITPTNVNYISLTLNNSCSTAPNIKNGKLITTKKKSAPHGYGIKSIKRIADKYDGDVSFEYDEPNYLFKMRIILKKLN
ncbi:MAG: GHKL domain-containing protein [Ruminococcus sp.]|nr:GHKL domain-containing protein [Ruminococcus sp.]